MIASKKIRVLILEGDYAVRGWIEKLVKKQFSHIELTTAKSIAEVEELLKLDRLDSKESFPCPYDAIVVGGKVEDGHAIGEFLHKRIQKRFPEVIIVINSLMFHIPGLKNLAKNVKNIQEFLESLGN